MVINKDNALTSKNKGKKTTICGYRRQRLAKLGVPKEYWERIASPLGSRFSFEKLNKPISITSIKDCPNKRVSQIVYNLARRGILQPNECYYNAYRLALILNKEGIRTNCVEGYYYTFGEWDKHRFNEIDGVYYDATAELFLSTPLDEIKYHGVRTYTAAEIEAISAAFGFLANNPYSFYFTSTLPLNRDFYSPADNVGIFYNEFCLDENGVICFNECSFSEKQSSFEYE